MVCPACDGRGGPAGPTACPRCGGRGELALAECPLAVLPADVWDLLEYAGFAEKGHWPEAGGMLDQAGPFVRACRRIWNEQARLRAQWIEERRRRT